MKLVDIILTLFFPPIAVANRYGIGKQFFLNLILTVVGWVPGVIHAWITVSKKTAAPELGTV